ncbi:MAG: hypothetical protein FWG83_02640 [Oscillospiraceae bacterium]|nr:hypothetical protein [Oscillospiraceae bacterium]
MKKLIATLVIVAALAGMNGCSDNQSTGGSQNDTPRRNREESTQLNEQFDGELVETKWFSFALKDGWKYKLNEYQENYWGISHESFEGGMTISNAFIQIIPIFDDNLGDLKLPENATPRETLEAMLESSLESLLDFEDYDNISHEIIKLGKTDALKMTLQKDIGIWVFYALLDNSNMYSLQYTLENEDKHLQGEIEEIFETFRIKHDAPPIADASYIENMRVSRRNAEATSIFIVVASVATTMDSRNEPFPTKSFTLTSDGSGWKMSGEQFEMIIDKLNHDLPEFEGHAKVFIKEDGGYPVAVVLVESGGVSSAEFNTEDNTWRGMDENRPGYDSDGNAVGVYPEYIIY